MMRFLAVAGNSCLALFSYISYNQFFSQYHGPKPELYGRYIDDCIGAQRGAHSIYNRHQFLSSPYTWEISDTSLAFLDIKISIEGNGLCTSVYYKPTDSHSY